MAHELNTLAAQLRALAQLGKQDKNQQPASKSDLIREFAELTGIKVTDIPLSRTNPQDHVGLPKFQAHKRPVQKVFQEDLDTPMTDMSGKGEKNGRCNITACGSRRHVVWYNRGTRAYYCKACAFAINRYCNPNELLCFDTTNASKYGIGERIRIIKDRTEGIILEEILCEGLVIKFEGELGARYPQGHFVRYTEVELISSDVKEQE